MESDSQRAQKRQRTGSAATNEPIRSDPWLSDGTIVLEAERRQFRVHKSVLAANSVIFKDMFELGQPDRANVGSRGDGLVDGCPVVHMSDAWTELRHVLKALYDRSYHTDATKAVPFEVVAAFLRLGKKYEIAHIQAEAMLRLTSSFPHTLSGYEKVAHTGSQCPPRLHQITLRGSYTALLLSTIDLAYATNTLRILPAAFYETCRLCTLDTILEGRRKTRSGEVFMLTQRSQAIWHRGRARILRAQVRHVYPWLFLANVRSRPCGDLMCRIARLESAAEMGEDSLVVALAAWTSQWPRKDGLCSRCANAAKAAYELGRPKFWDELPSYFDLPAWGVLLKD